MPDTYVHIVFNPYMPNNRINLIKAMRAVFGCGLYNAKKLTETCGIYEFDKEGENSGWTLIGIDKLASHGGVIVRLSTPSHIKPFDSAWRMAIDDAKEFFSVHAAQEPPPVSEL
jgi:hypothetical protein